MLMVFIPSESKDFNYMHINLAAAAIAIAGTL